MMPPSQSWWRCATGRTIGGAIESLLAADYPKKDIIVVDGESTDNTRKIASKYPVVLLSERRLSSFAARNTGIAKSRGQIILFTDGDCIVDSKWIRNILRNYANERVAGVGGLTLPYAEPYAHYTPKTFVEKYVVFASPPPPTKDEAVELHRSRDPVLSRALCLPTKNASFRVQALREVGNFDGDLISAGDTDICHRILSGGGTLLFDPQAVVYHIPRDNIFALIQQFLGYGIGQARLAHKEHSLKTGIATARVEHLRGIVAIVRDILLFITRLVTTPFRTDDVLFPILCPVIDNIRILTWYVGRIRGSLRYKVVAF